MIRIQWEGALGGVLKHTVSIFKGGEVQVAIDKGELEVYREALLVGNNDFRLICDLRSSDDVMELLMLTDALRQIDMHCHISIMMPYVPYARQDRVMNFGEALSIKVFANLINAQNYSSVVIVDPHSDVTPALLKNVVVVPQHMGLFSLFSHPKIAPKHPTVVREEVIFVSPDAGANKKIFKAAEMMKVTSVVRADKIRDLKTMAITGTTVYSEHVGKRDFLIIDDICDGGRTFIELAKVLRPLTDGKIYLYVTHGIFSYGLDALKGNIDHIFTPFCWLPNGTDEDFVTRVPLASL